MWGYPVINKQNHDSTVKQGLETFALVRIRILYIRSNVSDSAYHSFHLTIFKSLVLDIHNESSLKTFIRLRVPQQNIAKIASPLGTRVHRKSLVYE